MSKSNESKVMSHLFNVGIGTIINILLGLITTPLITRVASPEEYGQLAVFNSYADIALAFLYLGLDRSLMRFFYDSDDLNSKKSLLKYCFVLPIIAAILTSAIFLSLRAVGIVRVQFNTIICVLLCAYVVVFIWNKISTLMLRITYKTKEFSLCNVVQKIVYCLIIVAYVLFIKKNYFMMLVLSALISLAIASFIATISTKEYWNFIDVPSPNNKNEILKYSLPFILYSAMDALLDSMDKLALDKYCGNYDTGIYGSAVSLVGIFLIFKTIFETVWMPMQTEHYVKNPEDPTFIQKGSKYLTIILFFIGLNVMMFKDILCYILGSSYREAAPVMPFLFLAYTVYAISDTTVSGIDYSKRSYLHAITGVIAVIINFVGNNLLVPMIGTKGAAIATFISFFAYFYVRTKFSVKYYPVDYSLNRIYLMTLLSAIFAYMTSFMSISTLMILVYLIIMIIFIVIYLKDIGEMLNYFKDTLLGMFGK